MHVGPYAFNPTQRAANPSSFQFNMDCGTAP